MATDLNGIPLSIKLSAGQESEIKFAQPLLDSIAVQRKSGYLKRTPKVLLGDKAYASKAFRKELRRRHIRAIIPDRSNTKRAHDGRVKFDSAAYRLRNVVERTFGALKEKRRIATRYEKTAENYLSMVKLGCIDLFLQLLRN